MNRRVRHWTIRLVVAAAVLVPGRASGQGTSATPPAVSAADPRDVASPDALIAAVYDVISGPAGKVRNWNRWLSLFTAGARLVPATTGADKKPHIRLMTPEDYVQTVGPRLEQNGFFEREIGRTSESFGNITHVFSTYESKRTMADEKPFARGINSIQMFNDGSRWWLVTIFWDSERDDNRISAAYLRPAK